MSSRIVGAYCDGGCIQRNPSGYGGTWAYVYVGEDGLDVKQAMGVLYPKDFPSRTVSNNNSELYALCMAILDLPKDEAPCFYSDSAVSLGRVFSNWQLNNVPQWLRDKVCSARQKLQYLEFTYCLLDGHPTKAQLASGIGKRGNPCSKWNVLCDKLCNDEAKAYLELQGMETASGW